MPLPLHRTRGADAHTGKLFFAQVREDTDVELAALAGIEHGELAVVSSGGDHALALLAAGHRVHAVDFNTTQNDLVELRVAALATLDHRTALGFLGAHDMTGRERLRIFRSLRPLLTPGAVRRWNRLPRHLERGVLHAGVTERFLAGLWKVLDRAVLPAGVWESLLVAPDREAQRHVYDEGWDTWRWRALLRLACRRRVFDRVYDESFFRHTGRRDFADHFGAVFRHVLTELPVAENPYAHDLFTGGWGDVLPAALTSDAAGAIAGATDRLHVWDESMTVWLSRRERHSLDGAVLSNICEWMTPAEINDLFESLARAVKPGGVVVLRNFVGWTDFPPIVGAHFDVDEAETERLSAADRSLMQYRVVALHRRPQDRVRAPLDVVDLTPADGPRLSRLASSNPIRSATAYYVDRAASFPLVAAQGGELIGLAEHGDQDNLVAACCLLPSQGRAAGAPVRTLYFGGLVAAPSHPGAGAELVAEVRRRWAASGADIVIWLTNNDNDRIRRVADRTQPAGAANLADVAYTEAMPLGRAALPDGWHFDAAGPLTEQALGLINDHYAGCSLYTPVRGEDLDRLPGASGADLTVLCDPQGRLRAAAWIYDPFDYVRVIPTRFDRLSRAWERAVRVARRARVPLPDPPRVGQGIHTVQVRRLAYTDDEAGRLMAGQLGNLVLERKGHTLSWVEDVRSRFPRAHKLVFTYPGQVDAALAPDAPVDVASIRRSPLFVDITLT